MPYPPCTCGHQGFKLLITHPSWPVPQDPFVIIKIEKFLKTNTHRGANQITTFLTLNTVQKDVLNIIPIQTIEGQGYSASEDQFLGYREEQV